MPALPNVEDARLDAFVDELHRQLGRWPRATTVANCLDALGLPTSYRRCCEALVRVRAAEVRV